jgi:hypothetical protein
MMPSLPSRDFPRTGARTVWLLACHALALIQTRAEAGVKVS